MTLRLVVHIHDLPVWTVPPAQVERIRAALPDVDVVDTRSDAECRAAVPGADVMLATRIRPDTLAAADRLRWVHSSAVGVGGLPLAALAAKGVVVTNARGIHAATIAEHTMALMLALRRQLPAAMQRQAAGQWSQDELSTLVVPAASATRVLVVGIGSIGARVAAHAAAMGMSVVGIRRHPERTPPPGVERVYAADQLHALLPTVDVVVLAAPRTDETGALIGATELALMKPTALLINIARGGLIDEPALIDALSTGRLGGAGLDVVSREPLDPASPLWTLPNVIITPHTAAFAGDYWTPVVDAFLQNMKHFRAGAPLDNLVDPELGY
jgi:phosphoglycerate dehydrogenase-like enzyme